MHPALSVVFLTTLIGAGQGLLVVLFGAELAHVLARAPIDPIRAFLVCGSAVALVLTALGLVASIFHLGRPARGWRAAAAWRTSWLSREVIVMPAFMAAVFAYGLAHLAGLPWSLAIGAVGVLLALALFVCTGMIYAAVRAIREWATPLTVVNYTLLGIASGSTLAAALAALTAPALTPTLAWLAAAATALAGVGRLAALARNARLRPVTTPQTAIGIKHPRIVQRSQGAMGGSFNTREFFHGRDERFVATVRRVFLLLAFVLPLALLLFGTGSGARGSAAAQFAVLLSFPVQFVGLLAERWFFFAQANHTQNLYYRSVA